MWTCKQCKSNFHFNQVEPAIDNGGFYFECPKCKHRNALTNIAKPGEPLALAQVDA